MTLVQSLQMSNRIHFWKGKNHLNSIESVLQSKENSSQCPFPAVSARAGLSYWKNSTAGWSGKHLGQWRVQVQHKLTHLTYVLLLALKEQLRLLHMNHIVSRDLALFMPTTLFKFMLSHPQTSFPPPLKFQSNIPPSRKSSLLLPSPAQFYACWNFWVHVYWNVSLHRLNDHFHSSLNMNYSTLRCISYLFFLTSALNWTATQERTKMLMNN